MDQKLKHFEVILGSVEKIQKELDELKEWIHLQIYEVKGEEYSNEHSQNEIDSSGHDNLMFIDPVIVKNEIITTEDFILPDSDQDPFNNIEEMSYQNPVGHSSTTIMNTSVVRPKSKSKMTKKSNPTSSNKVTPIQSRRPAAVVERSNCRNQSSVKYMRSFSGKKDSYILVVNGYTFHRSAVRQSKTHWICSQSGSKYFKCRAAAATATEAPVSVNEFPKIVYIAPVEDHTHPPTLTTKRKT